MKKLPNDSFAYTLRVGKKIREALISRGSHKLQESVVGEWRGGIKYSTAAESEKSFLVKKNPKSHQCF